MGMYKWFDEIMDPWIATLYSIPVIAHCADDYHLVRHRHVLKVIVVFKITLVAIILNTAAGIKNSGPRLARARSVDAS